MNRIRPLQSILVAVIILIWAIFVIAFYFVVHRPFDKLQALALASSLLDVLVVLILVCLAGGVGRSIFGDLHTLNIFERTSLHFSLGLGVISLVLFAAGLAGLFKPLIAWMAALLGLVVFRKPIVRWLKDLRAGMLQSAPGSRMDWLFFCFVIFVLVINLSLALAPPTRWDSLVYHLEIPQRYVQNGGISFLPDNLYAGFPGVSSMWFSWALLISAPEAAAVFGWVVGVMAVLGLVGFASRVVNRQYSWLAPAILLSGSSVSQALHWAYVDWWVILFGIVIWVILINYLEDQARLWLVLAGMEIGFVIGVKYTAGISLVLFGLVLLVYYRRSATEELIQTGKADFSSSLTQPLSGAGWLRLLKESLILALIVLVMVSPWLLKNYFYTGQPLYPVLTGQPGVDPWQQTFGKDPFVERSWLDDLLLPIDATIYAVEGAQVAGKPEYSASIGPLYLALILAIWLDWRKKTVAHRKLLTIFLIVAAGNWFLWAALSHFANELIWPRHYFGVFPLLAILAAVGYQSFTGLHIGQVRLQSLLASLVILALFSSAIVEWQSWVKRNPLPVLSGIETQNAYLTRELGAYYQAIEVINRLSTDEKVLFLWEPRVLYCQKDCLTDATLDNWWYLRKVYPNNEILSSELCRRGLTHVLLYQTGVEWMKKQTSIYSDQDWLALDAFLDSQATISATAGNEYILYQLNVCPKSAESNP